MRLRLTVSTYQLDDIVVLECRECGTHLRRELERVGRACSRAALPRPVQA